MFGVRDVVRLCWVDSKTNKIVIFASSWSFTRVGTLIVATIYLQLIQNRYMFRSFMSFSVVTSIVYNPFPAMWKS